ncbi:uncharacterized protein HMPREF1541_04515 [Cyphellophora europaea CBS 101466]|uniref:Uncharacterized protein n=1 Tax=Cyphellophora europaea (strain CBS 101466) TaxID=1220924 RepID=W2RX15_CYPE1|nr:uncharacterized protein HMPREF1541_04515 [Cyphellophora europaea CBS 101466]ETN40239.1 hypothetical protein HMPREF1541_04515 [Cyphellophora europaea CBS 101466]
MLSTSAPVSRLASPSPTTTTTSSSISSDGWTFTHDDESCPIPEEHNLELTNTKPTVPSAPFPQQSRSARARLCHLHHLSDATCSAAEIERRDYALQLSLWRYLNSVPWSSYGDDDWIYLPLPLHTQWRLVSKTTWQVEAAKHRFYCKCGLPNTPLLAMRQAAFCDEGEEGEDAAGVWLREHWEREQRYSRLSGGKYTGIEAPVEDPFPDGRGVRPRIGCATEKGEEGEENRGLREACWRQGRRLPGFLLGEEAYNQDAWLPECRWPVPPLMPDGSSSGGTELWRSVSGSEDEEQDYFRPVMVNNPQWLESACLPGAVEQQPGSPLFRWPTRGSHAVRIVMPEK